MDYWGGGGGASTYPCAKHVANWGHAPPGNLVFLSFIRRNLVESGSFFAQAQFTIYCVIKAFIKA